MTTHDRLFPIFLKLSGRSVLVVGAGPVAASKLAALVEAGARIHVVAPRINPDIERMGVRLSRRKFRPSDLDSPRGWLWQLPHQTSTDTSLKQRNSVTSLSTRSMTRIMRVPILAA